MWVTLDDLKGHLNVTTAADDTLLTDKIAAAEAWVSGYTAIEIDTEAGDVPEPVKEAVRQLSAHLYENREASLVGVSAEQLPFGFLDLLVNYRAWAF